MVVMYSLAWGTDGHISLGLIHCVQGPCAAMHCPANTSPHAHCIASAAAGYRFWITDSSHSRRECVVKENGASMFQRPDFLTPEVKCKHTVSGLHYQPQAKLHLWVGLQNLYTDSM